MNITAKCYTSVRYTQEQLKSMRQRIQLVSTNPVHFFYRGEKLEIDHIGVHVTPQRYGFDLAFSDVLEFPDIPEGHEITIQMISTNGEPDYERYIGNFNVTIAPPSLQSRFHEYFEKDIQPTPLTSERGDVVEDVAEIAQMLGVDSWTMEQSSGLYVITIDNCLAAKASELHQLHSEFLRGIAMSARYPIASEYLNGCFDYGRKGQCQSSL